jgi:NTE family protein
MIKNLVFSASGSNIFIHLGFLKYLGNNNMLDIADTFIGTSGGAIMALIISLGYDLDTITELFLKIDSEKLKKIDTNSVLNFFDNYGLDDGENMERVLRIILKTKHKSDRITFKELYETYTKKLVICSINLQKHQEVYFEYKKYPDLDVIDAVLMSLSIPIMFSPRRFDGDLYVDGGLICPYPIDFLESDSSLLREETLGIIIAPDYYICKENMNYDIMFCNKDLQRRVEIDTFEKYLFSVLSCGSIKLLKERYEKYKDITVLVINDKNGLNFDVDIDIRETLINEGYIFTETFFNMRERNKLEVTKPLEKNEHEHESNDLSEADLSEADLSEADLSDEKTIKKNDDLSEADLSEADLSEADLSEADLSDEKTIKE